MSAEAALTPDPDVAMLARLAALDMASAEQAHARLMAATDVQEINDLGRTYERFARSLRRTLALKARLAQDAAMAAERREALAPRRPPLPPLKAGPSPADLRIQDLQDAVLRIGHAHGLRGERALEGLYERLDEEVGDWAERDDFAGGGLDAQVRWLCGRLGLPVGFADAWRDLPHPDDVPPPWAEFESAPSDETAPDDPAADGEPPLPPAPVARPEGSRWHDPLPSHWDTG